MFLGASVVSVFEVLELILLQIKALCCGRDESKVDDVGGGGRKKEIIKREQYNNRVTKTQVRAFNDDDTSRPTKKGASLFYV